MVLHRRSDMQEKMISKEYSNNIGKSKQILTKRSMRIKNTGQWWCVT